MISVLIVDDHEAFRRAAAELVSSVPGVTVAGQASSGERAIAQVASSPPDIVLMDVRMPGMGGLEAARRIATTNPETLVVLLSTDTGAEADEVPAIVNKRALTADFLRSLASTFATRSHIDRGLRAEPESAS